MLASAGASIKFWNLENFTLKQEVPTSSIDEISNLSWNKDGQFLLALSRNSEIPLYAVSSKTATCSNILRVINQPKCIQFSNTTQRFLAIAGAKDTVLVWDIKSNTKKKSFKVPIRDGNLSHLSFSSTDSHLVVGTTNGEAYLLSNTNNLVTGPMQLFKEKTVITDLQFSQNSHFLVGASSESGCVSFLDANTKVVLKEISNSHSAPISGLCFSPINELLMVTVGYDKKFNSYNVNVKREIISHISSAPLTSVCFVGNGVQIALGTMKGDVLIHDLRTLKLPLATLPAYEGSVRSLKLQPSSKAMIAKISKSELKNSSEKLREKQISWSAVKSANSQKTPVAISNVSNTCSGITPTLDIISPVTLSQNEFANKKFEMQTTPKSVRKNPAIIDLGILSPIDKENQSPVIGHNEVTQLGKRGNGDINERLIDELLSPLSTSMSSNTSMKSLKIRHQLSSRKKEVFDLTHECLSPVESDPSSTVKTGSTFKSSPNVENVSKSPLQCIERTYGRDPYQLHSVKRELLKDDDLLENSNKPKIDSSSKFFPLMSNLNTEVKQNEEIFKPPCETENISPNNISLITVEKDVAETSSCLPSSLSATSTDNKNGPSKMTEKQNLECGLPESKDNSQTKCVNKKEVKFKDLLPDQETSIPTGDHGPTSSMNLELIQNCIADALESYQFDVNKRFMHVQFLMTKQFLQLQNEMRDLFRENSLNEEILLENERLREEIKRLKANY